MRDLDVEGGTTVDEASVSRRNKALAKVQKARPSVVLSYTLPVMPTGLGEHIFVIKNAKKHGVRVDVVNIMAMDYGSSFGGDMGTYAIDAAKRAFAEVQAAGFSGARIGICPMIGVNDVRNEVFSVANARAVRDFALRTPWVRWLSFWSINRDNSRMSSELPTSSGVRQREWEFSSEFAKFK